MKRRAFVGTVLAAAWLASHRARGGEPRPLRLATTTSTDHSGLLGVLLPPFEQATGQRVHVIAVGTGKALQLARRGDVDVLLVHDREAEDRLVADGVGVNRRAVMYNEYVIVGPPADPAGIRGLREAAGALRRIAVTASAFVSRGDESGTHQRERKLWQAAGVTPARAWYREVGQGMGRVLQMAGEMEAYTLVDRGTWLALGDKVPLALLVEGDPLLFNPYAVLAVNPERFADVDHQGAMRLIAWMTSASAQRIIEDFRVGGEPLFHPIASGSP